MKKILGFILVLVLLFGTISSPVIADTSKTKDLKVGDVIAYEDGVYDIFLGKVGKDLTFKRVFGNPIYLPDGSRVQTTWGYDTDRKGFTIDHNFFEAFVDKLKVTVIKEEQKLSWAPDLYIDGKKVNPLSEYPTLLMQDPINENYIGNTLEWNYGVAKRHLRVIEGVISEKWIFETDPGGEVRIKSNSLKDDKYLWEISPFAHDADNQNIPVRLEEKEKVVTAEDMAKATYPVVIDPTSSFVTSASDGYMVGVSTSYSTARGLTECQSAYLYKTLTSSYIGQYYTGGWYHIYRSTVFFDTSSLGEATVDSAKLRLYGLQDLSATDFNIVIQTGMPTYPRDPMVVGDYNRAHYSGNGGQFATSGFSTAVYNNVTLSADGLDWINRSGTTKFMLRSSRDIAGNTPTGDERVRVYSYEQGTGYWPILEVTYSYRAPAVTTNDASDVSITTAKLHGYLNDDGGEACQVMFEYDTSSGAPYTYNTSWLAGTYNTGEYFNYTVDNLTAEQTYYFRAVAKNSEDTTYGSEKTFTTLASLNPPTEFKATTRSDTEVSLTWVRGVGASETYVRYKVGSYPSDTSDGTYVTRTDKGSHLLTGLTPGVPYYIKAWGWDADVYSNATATDVTTTFAEGPVTLVTVEPPTFSNFFGPGTYDGLSNLPVYERFNAIADEIGIPRVNFWLYLIIGFAIVMGAGFYIMTKQPIFAIFGVSLGIIYGWLVGPIPGWILLVYVIGAGAVAYVLMKGGAEHA